MRQLVKDWQVGDGREAALQRYVLANARPGHLDDAIRTIDRFDYSSPTPRSKRAWSRSSILAR